MFSVLKLRFSGCPEQPTLRRPKRYFKASGLADIVSKTIRTSSAIEPA